MINNTILNCQIWHYFIKVFIGYLPTYYFYGYKNPNPMVIIRYDHHNVYVRFPIECEYHRHTYYLYEKPLDQTLCSAVLLDDIFKYYQRLTFAAKNFQNIVKTRIGVIFVEKNNTQHIPMYTPKVFDQLRWYNNIICTARRNM